MEATEGGTTTAVGVVDTGDRTAAVATAARTRAEAGVVATTIAIPVTTPLIDTTTETE